MLIDSIPIKLIEYLNIHINDVYICIYLMFIGSRILSGGIWYENISAMDKPTVS